MIALGNFLFRYRNGLGPVVFLLSVFLAEPFRPLGSSSMDMVLDIAGVLVALLGEGLRVLTVGYEYIKRGGKDYRVYASTLVRGGAFGVSRNPLYLGNILIGLGAALIVNAYVFYLMGLLLVAFAYACIVAAEEAYLRNKFSQEYADYCRQVPRWWPRWSAWRQSTRNMRFNWRRVLNKEYNTLFMVPLLLAVVKLWSDYRIAGPAALPSTGLLAAALAFWLLLYLLARSMKKLGYVKA